MWTRCCSTTPARAGSPTKSLQPHCHGRPPCGSAHLFTHIQALRQADSTAFCCLVYLLGCLPAMLPQSHCLTWQELLRGVLSSSLP